MKLTKPGQLRSFAAHPLCSADVWYGRAVSGEEPRRLSAPVAVEPVPAVSAFDPVATDPGSVVSRRQRPAAGDPDICVAIPAVMAGNPHVPRTWRDVAGFHDGCRWADAD